MAILLATLLGGVGLFLVGMTSLTDGLKSLAGDALRRALVRFTGRPLKAFASGVLATLLVQSSSATTVTVIGLVSAGLLTFPQAVGVVLGASLGTTGTGWVVSLVGLKVNVGFYALPLVGCGALMRLLGRGRVNAFGQALAGFGLIFVGIDTLQRGMEGLTGLFDLQVLPPAGILGRVLLMLVGVLMTVVMQSSSAAVATILTALHSGSVNFEQAALLVIGASIGTTVTSALAAIGAGIPARRTALAHILFNLATGVIALLLLPLLLWGISLAQERLGLAAGATSLAAFHSLFIFVGVLVFLPGANRFSRFIERLLPERAPNLTRHLDGTVLDVPPVALETTRRVLTEIACELLDAVRQSIESQALDGGAAELPRLEQALEETERFLARIPPLAAGEPMAQARVAQMHAVDHLVRLLSHFSPPHTLRDYESRTRLRQLLEQTQEILAQAAAGLRKRGPENWLENIATISQELADLRRDLRVNVLQEAGTGSLSPTYVLALLDAMRWLDRIGFHAWKIGHYLGSESDRSDSAPREASQHED